MVYSTEIVMDLNSCVSPLNSPPCGEASLVDVTYDRGLQRRDSTEQTAERLFELLYSHIGSEPKSYTSSFPPALLFAICEVLRHDSSPLPASSDILLLPSVLSKLRSWRLLDRPLRHSFETIQKLAKDVAEIPRTDFRFQTSAGIDRSPSRPTRLRIKWTGRAPTSSHDGDPRSSFESGTTSPSSMLKAEQLETREMRSSGTVHDVSRRSSLCTVHSAGVTQDDSTIVGFRSGCSACRQPRTSLSSSPQTPQLRGVESSKDPCDEHVVTPQLVLQKSTPTSQGRKKVKVSKIPTLATRKSEVDENEPPVQRPINTKPAVAFPRRGAPWATIPTIALPMHQTTSDASTSSPIASVGGVLLSSPITNIDHNRIEIRRGNVNRRAASNDLRPTAPVICASASDLRGRALRAQSFSRRPAPPTPKSKMPELMPNRTLSHSSTDHEFTVLPPAIISRCPAKGGISAASALGTPDGAMQPRKPTGGHPSAVRSSIPNPMNMGIARRDMCWSSPRRTSRNSFTTPSPPQPRNWQP